MRAVFTGLCLTHFFTGGDEDIVCAGRLLLPKPGAKWVLFVHERCSQPSDIGNERTTHCEEMADVAELDRGV
jgi:hypothetical protein